MRWVKGCTHTGRKDTPTPEGSFNLTWRARSRRSTDNADWLLEWYFNFVNERGVSFHLFELPGMAPGTPVFIVGTYAFGAPPPWLAIDAPQIVLPRL